MKNTKITFSEEEARSLAERYYIKFCGLDFEKEKHRRMYREAMDVRSNGIQGIKIQARISSFGSEAFKGHKVTACGFELECRAFEQIPDKNVKGGYLYMITAGECSCGQDEAMTRQLFADLWGTAYIDAGRDLLGAMIHEMAEEELRAGPGGGGYLSGSFGPGFYGMELVESINIERILNGSDIGVKVLESGIMLPMKTCSGLYLVVDDPDQLPAFECEACIGNPGGCEFCSIRHKA